MSEIRKLILENVRCFQGRQELDIRPLTFLVGENSTGKSTSLGCLQVLGNFFIAGEGSIDFNSKPYQMGSFTDIVRKSNPKNDCFKLGIKFRTEPEPFTCLISLSEREIGSTPIVDEIQYGFDDGEITIVRKNVDVDYIYLEITEHGENRYTVAYGDSIVKFQIGLSL